MLLSSDKLNKLAHLMQGTLLFCAIGDHFARKSTRFVTTCVCLCAVICPQRRIVGFVCPARRQILNRLLDEKILEKETSSIY